MISFISPEKMENLRTMCEVCVHSVFDSFDVFSKKTYHVLRSRATVSLFHKFDVTDSRR